MRPPTNPPRLHAPFSGWEIVTRSAVIACESPVPAALTHWPAARSAWLAATSCVTVVELDSVTVTFFVFAFGGELCDPPERARRWNVVAFTTTSFPFTLCGNLISTLDDMGRWGRALGAGKLLSKKSHDLQVGDQLVGLGPLTGDLHYGMGVGIYNDSWYIANPQVDGYSGVVASSPKEKITVAVFSTGAQGSDIEVSYSAIVFNAIGQALAPARAPELKTNPRG